MSVLWHNQFQNFNFNVHIKSCISDKWKAQTQQRVENIRLLDLN